MLLPLLVLAVLACGAHACADAGAPGSIYIEGDNATIIQIFVGDGETADYYIGTILGQGADVPGAFSQAQLRGWSAQAGYQYILLGHFQQAYAQEPIVWRVLSVQGGKALLLSERILYATPYDEDSNDWLSSDACRWLHDDFYRSAFSDTERAAIVYSQDAGYVFLPARGDMQNPAYGFNADINAPDHNRKGFSTPYAINNKVWTNTDGGSSYFLRTVPNKKNVDQIRSEGALGVARVERDNVGIRPMLVVDTALLPFQAVNAPVR